MDFKRVFGILFDLAPEFAFVSFHLSLRRLLQFQSHMDLVGPADGQFWMLDWDFMA
jgi:hypothetical protein